MRQLFVDKGIISVKQVAEPLLHEQSVLVRVHYSCISSGTEIATIAQAKASMFSNVPFKVKKVLQALSNHGLDATTALIKSKLKGDIQSLGYSCSGQVIAVGSQVRTVRVGDFVACAGAGYAHHADLVCVPELLVAPLSDQSVLKHASMTTLGAIALHGIRQAHVALGEIVCIIGLGLLGQLSVQLAKKSGCTVIGIDLMPERTALATTLGADYVYCPTQEESIEDSILFLTQHHGVDATIITASSTRPEIMHQALQLTRKRGRIIIVGDISVEIPRELWYKKEIEVTIACSYGPGRYDPTYEQQGHDYPYAYVRWTQQRNMISFIRFIEDKAITLAPLISQETTLDFVEQAYENIKQGSSLGVILDYQTAITSAHQFQAATITSITPTYFTPARHEAVYVGFVGVGGFAKTKLLPTVAKIKDVIIHGIADVDIANALQVGRTYGAAKICSLDDELCMADDIDVLVIASPHKYHCDQALKALQAGKAVFLEKPMVTTFDQLKRFHELLAHYPNPALCVDYNRSFSPFMQKIKRAIAQRTTPLMVQYRMNAGFIPKEHWVQTDLGAGRIIGEACHIIDLFCFLTDSKPLSVGVESLQTQRDDLFPTDNFMVQIRFTDGSLCTLTYTALGNNQLGKEYMELHFEGKSIIMNDYLHLEGYGLPLSFNETASTQQKGHSQLLQLFFEQVRAEQFLPPIGMDRLFMVAQLTLLIDKLACAGGGTQEWSL